MPKKFDTNPLDPEFAERAKAASANYGPPPKTPFSTAEFPTAPASITEEETRRFNDADFQALFLCDGPARRTVSGSKLLGHESGVGAQGRKDGVPEKWLIGFHICRLRSAVAGLVLLLVIPKDEAKVRFTLHRPAAHVGILIVLLFIESSATVTNVADFGSFILSHCYDHHAQSSSRSKHGREARA
jgi:hypothetical protein